MLSIIIPVYNEAEFVLRLLEKIIAADFVSDYEMIIVDDGSTDNSYEIIEGFRKSCPENISKNISVFHKSNGGKGSAVRFGLSKAKGDIIVFQDADLEYEPKELSVLLRELQNSDRKTAIYGSRFLKDETNWTLPSHYIANKILSLAMSLVYGRWVGDIETGYKMFYSDSIKGIDLVSDGFEIEPEITAKLIKNGFSIKEVPITYNPRSYEEGKKITWKDGVKALHMLLKCRFK